MVAEQLGIFGSEIFQQVILPFLLIFVVVYAILERTELLGKDKHQSNAIVALVIGLIVVGVPATTAVMMNLIPVIVTILIVLLSFLLLLGFIGEVKEGAPKTGKAVLIILLSIAFIISVLWATNALPAIVALKEQPWAGVAFNTVLIVAVIAAVVAIVVYGGKAKGGAEKPAGASA